MSNENLSAVYQQTISLYGQLASHTIEAYYGVAQRTITGVDAGITSLLNSERVKIAEGLRSRLGNAHRTVSGAIEGGVSKARSDARGFIEAAVKSTNDGIDRVAGLAGKFDEKFPQVSAATAPALQVGLPAARLNRDVVQYVADGVERLVDRISVSKVAEVKTAARAAKASVRKTAGKATAAAKSATRRARKAA